MPKQQQQQRMPFWQQIIAVVLAVGVVVCLAAGWLHGVWSDGALGFVVGTVVFLVFTNMRSAS